MSPLPCVALPISAFLTLSLLLATGSPALAWQCSPPAPPPPCDVPPITTGTARVWRDANGVAHIEANTEVDAWRALGYEEARDALISVQFNIKRYRGEISKYVEADSGLPQNDFAVKYYKAHLKDALGGDGPAEEARLRTLLERTGVPPAQKDQVFDNLKAYAEGLDAYRQRLSDPSSSLTTPEIAYRDWLNANYPWALKELVAGQDHAIIGLFDVASWGSHRKAVGSFAVAQLKDPRPPTPLFPLSATPGPLTNQEALSHPPFQNKPSGYDLGSNAFCWSNSSLATFMSPTLPFRGGLVADPHQSFYLNGFSKGASTAMHFADENGGATFAHVRVCSTGLDVFGWKDPGAGVFNAFFNKDVAIAGSQGSGNPSDAFLLSVLVDSNNQAVQYYSYHNTPPGFVNFDSAQTIQIQVKGEPARNVVVKRAGLFGVVFEEEDHAFYAPQTGWNISVTEPVKNTFIFPGIPPDPPMPPPGFIHAVIALRTAFDQGLPGPLETSPKKRLYRLAVGTYEAMHATSVADVRQQMIIGDYFPGPNLIAMDRAGRIFALNSADVPQRGNDAAIAAYLAAHPLPPPYEQPDLADKVDIYDQDDEEPVPARNAEDQAFDWVLDATFNAQPLKPEGPGDTINQDYLPYLYFDPAYATPGYDVDMCTQTSLIHPEPIPLFTGSPPVVNPIYESPGFATMSNNEVFRAYKRQFTIDDNAGGPCSAMDRRLNSPDSALFSYEILTATSYASRSPGAQQLEKNKNIISFLVDVAHPAGRPPMACSQAWSFAVDNRLYTPGDYTGYKKSDCTQAGGGQVLPVPVRNLAEIKARIGDVVAEAEKEKQFFVDLRNWLGTHPAYRARWVDNTLDPYWYPNPGTIQYFDMPTGYALIDFLWSESRLGRRRLAEGSLMTGDFIMTAEDQNTFTSLVSTLESWTGFRNDKTSQAAGLLLEYDLGFNAASNGLANTLLEVMPVLPNMDEEGRVWTPLHDGKLWAAVGRPMSVPSSGYCESLLGPTGLLPGSWSPEGEFQPSGCSPPLRYLFRYYQTYKALADMMFTENEYASVMFDCNEDLNGDGVPDAIEDHPIMKVPLPPYGALYDSMGGVKQSLTEADVNALVKFFLVDLGGFTLTPGTPQSTTSKTSKIANWNKEVTSIPYPSYYPLTRNLLRVLFMRRLLEAKAFMDNNGPLTTWGDVVRARVYDFNGVLRYGPVDGMPCDGPSIRRVVTYLEPDEGKDQDEAAARGFQARIWAGGGSDKTMLVLFPNDPEAYPLTYFLHYPGTTQSAFASPHFVGMVDHFRNRTNAQTHFTDYRDHLSTDMVTFPQNPYTYP